MGLKDKFILVQSIVLKSVPCFHGSVTFQKALQARWLRFEPKALNKHDRILPLGSVIHDRELSVSHLS